MQKFNSSSPNKEQSQNPYSKKITTRKKSRTSKPILFFLLGSIIFGGIIFVALTIGSIGGYQTGLKSQHATQTLSAHSNLDEQFSLALQDIAEKRYEAAFQRLDFIINQDPGYPEATDRMAEVMSVLYATATPTALPTKEAPTPTPDLRPVTELFEEANRLFAAQKWTEAIDTLTNLRKADAAYQTPRVDGILFISLRMRGIDKIWKSGDLEGGIYDLALASKFGPLDAQSVSARDLARLYLMGSSFWEVDPAQAIQYFSQVAAAAPGMIDASGWTARARYRAVLIQYADLLMAKKDWCNAQQQYELALSLGSDANTQTAAQNAALKCSPPTATGEVPTATSQPTLQPSLPPSETIPPNTVEPPTSTPVPPSEETPTPYP